MVKPSAILRTVPLLITMGTIFFLSHQPGDSLHLYPLPGIDKLAHFGVYALLAGTVIFAISPSTRSAKPGMTAALSACFCLLYGISDELHQSFIPHRDVSVLDLVAECAGAFTVCVAWYRLRLKPAGNWWSL
jgi:VanZ family protein